jgi:hypothetical protein
MQLENDPLARVPLEHHPPTNPEHEIAHLPAGIKQTRPKIHNLTHLALIPLNQAR